MKDRKMFKHKLIVSLTVTALAGMASSYSFAWDAPKMPKVGSGDSATSGSTVDVNALTGQQADLLKSMSSSLKNMAQSQALMADALGLKDKSDLAKKTATGLEKGDLTGKDDIEKTVTNTLEVKKAIDAELSKGTKLSDESKAKFTSSLPFYGKGALDMITTSKKAAEAAKSLSSVTDLSVLSKLSSLIYIAKNTPSMVSAFGSTTTSLISFSKSNGISTTEIEKSAAGLGN